MTSIANILLKVLVKQFYIINAGFLLFLFFFFFGMVNSGQLISYHQSLILAMLGSPVFMGVVWLAWLFYNIKCILFCTAVISAADNGYIFSLRGLSNSKQIFLYLLVSILLYAPVWIYSCLIVYLAINKSLILIGLLVTGFQFSMVALGAWTLFRVVNHKVTAFWPLELIANITKKFSIPLVYYSFLLGYILDKKKMAFTMVKIFSILLLKVSFVINGDQFDEDLFNLFFLLIFVAHAILVFYLVDFSETQLQFSRNLPISVSKIMRMYFFTYSILLLPEAGFMLINNNGNLPVTDIVLLYLTSISTLFLCTAILYGCGLNMESYLFFVFMTFMMIFFLQKTAVQLLTMICLLITGIAVFKTYYHSFERE